MENLFQPLLDDNFHNDVIGLEILNEIYGHADLNEICKYYDLEAFKKLTNSHRNYFKIIHLNACGLTNIKFDELKIILKSLTSKPDVICITETWLDKYNMHHFNLKGYKLYHLTRTERSHGGIAVFVAEKFNASQISKHSYIEDDIEILTLDITLNNKTHSICTIYRPHTKHHRIKEFTDILNNLITHLNPKKRNIILLGDLNINLLEYITHAPTNQFLTNMQSQRFNPIICRATRFPFEGQRGSPSLLDHIFTSFISRFSTGILKHEFSDHFPTFLYIPIAQSQNNTIIHKHIRILNHTNKLNFKNSLVNTNWNNIIHNNDVNIDCDQVIRHINQIYNETCPLKLKKVTQRMIENPWITTGIIKSSKVKNMYFKDYKNGIIPYEYYCNYRNLFNKIVQKSKTSYYKNIFTNFKHNTKKIWDTINELQAKRKNKMDYPIEINGEKLLNQSDVANEFNKFYSNIAPKLDDSLPQCNKDPLSYLRGNYNESLVLPIIVDEDIIKVIKSLKNKKNNIHEVPIELIKDNAAEIAVPLTCLFNNSIRSGVFPECLKKSTVIPLYKSGPKSDPSNYRPISLISTFAKIFESLMKTILTNYLDSKSIISSKQFGFCKNKSTFDCLNIVTSDIYQALDSHKAAILILVDFTKAFDTVRHSILLRKLWHYGIRGVIYDWFESYLKNRVQTTSCNKNDSSEVLINYGVPQGSILGPVLFLLYINDLPNIFTSFKVVLFADDSSFYIIDSDLTKMIHRSNIEMEKFHVWAISNRPTINIKKTKNMILTKKKVWISSSHFSSFESYR